MGREITFLSDYGPGSDYVGICHGVIARLAPEAGVVDLAHDIPAGDVRSGAHVLARSLKFLAAAVHLAVVDPGVGTARRGIAIAAGRPARFLVGPDNGLLARAAERLGGLRGVVDVGASAFRLEPVTGTFDGRDVFAPVAAALARGAPLETVGDPIDPDDIVAPPHPVLEPGEGSLRSEIVYVDGFGNLVLAASDADIEAAGLSGVVLAVDGRPIARVRAFAEADPGGLLLHPDSFGDLELAVRDGSAAGELGLGVGDVVELRAR